MKTSEEHDKLMIFGYIVAYLGLPENGDPTKYNGLTDELYTFIMKRVEEKQ